MCLGFLLNKKRVDKVHIDVQDNSLNTPLGLAFLMGRQKAAQSLIEAGADIKAFQCVAYRGCPYALNRYLFKAPQKLYSDDEFKRMEEMEDKEAQEKERKRLEKLKAEDKEYNEYNLYRAAILN